MDFEITKASTKGQMVIPARFRKALKIRAGTRLSVQQIDGRLIVEPINGDYIDRICGMLGDTSQMIKDLIREHDEEG